MPKTVNPKNIATITTITIDGPSGVGKSTLAKMVAQKLALPYLDTGAMFRAIAFYSDVTVLELSPQALQQKLQQFTFTLKAENGNSLLYCNGNLLGQEIRQEEVALKASIFAKNETVRDYLKEIQQKLSRNASFVVEGRDMGTVVFPQAQHKIFLDANPEVRTKRRILQLQEQGETANLATVTEQITLRDEQDRNRAISPLRPAPDALCIDTSIVPIEEVLQKILEHCA